MNFELTSTGKKTIPKIASERLLVKGGLVVNHEQTFRADVFVENGVIRQLGTDLTIPGGVTTIDAKGALVLPGGVDPTTNFEAVPWFDGDTSSANVKTVDNFYSGTRSALLGGTTTIVDVATGDKGRLTSSFNEKVEASEISCCDVSLHVDVTSWNDEVKQKMTSLATDHGVNSFKLHMCGRWQLNDTELYEALEHIKSLECVALVHAENGLLIRKKSEVVKRRGIVKPGGILSARNEDFEFEAVNRVLVIAKQMLCPLYFIHVTGEKAMKYINKARADGYPVYSQVLAVALHQDGLMYYEPSWSQAAACVTHPPLREGPNARERQLAALSNDNIQCVSSGHCVFNNTEKAMLGKNDFSKIPPGTNGVYERMMALWSTAVTTGYIDTNQFVALTSTNAARIFNLYPKKGHIGVGSDADLVIWRETESFSLASAAAALNVTKPDCSNAFESLECDSFPSTVICKGRVVFDDNQPAVIQSYGRLLKRSIAPPFVYNRLKIYDRADSSPATCDDDTLQLSSTVNGSIVDDAKSKTNEIPERFTRTSGIRAMHQSGWSFSGEQVGDSEHKTSKRFATPPGGLSQLSFK